MKHRQTRLYIEFYGCLILANLTTNDYWFWILIVMALYSFVMIFILHAKKHVRNRRN